MCYPPDPLSLTGLSRIVEPSAAAPAEKTGIAWIVRPPVVLQVLPALETGGVERGTVEIAAALSAAGARPVVVSVGGLLVRDVERAGRRHITLPVDSKNPATIYRNVTRLAQVIQECGADIIHARSRAPAWSALGAARQTGCAFLTTFHGTYGAGNRVKRSYNSVMTRGELIIAISNFIAGHMYQVYAVDPARIRVVPRGVDLEVFDPAHVSAERVIQLSRAWRLPDDVPVVMLPGRLTRWKGQLVLIEALAKLGRGDVRCVLVGSDQGRHAYRRELEETARRLGVAAQVQIAGHCRDMAAAYMLSDVVVSASTDPEAFGRVAAEAQAMGRPVIATDHGGARETVLPDRTGWLVRPGDSDALAAALETALSLDEAARGRIAGAAMQFIRETFSLARMRTATLSVYDELMVRRYGSG